MNAMQVKKNQHKIEIKVPTSITNCHYIFFVSDLTHTKISSKNCQTHTTPFENAKRWLGKTHSFFFLLNDAYMIGEHKETRMKMPNMCPFEKRYFLTWIDLNPGFGRN